jgi:diguanylate cyclase (GGDEF)-like protein
LDTRLLKELVAALPDPVFIFTETGRYGLIVGGQDSTLYHEGSHLVGTRLHDVLPKDKADWFLEQIRIALEGDSVHTVEYALSGDDVQGLNSDEGPQGRLFFEGRIQPLSMDYKGERAVVWVARNITSRHALEEKLRRLSETDPLTGLFNRRKLMDRLEERFREFTRYGEDTALILFDADHFKRINDRYGHATGDDVLKRLGEVCAAQLRDVDLLCRIGGEEFAALLPKTDLSGAHWVADRLRLVMEQLTVEEVQSTEITISVGVSEFASGDASVEDIIKRADDALYQAKREGRNRVCLADS